MIEYIQLFDVTVITFACPTPYDTYTIVVPPPPPPPPPPQIKTKKKQLLLISVWSTRIDST